MVERIMRNPAVVAISEADVAGGVASPAGPCLVCSAWIAPDEDAFVVSVGRRDGDAVELVAHVHCLRGMTHASIALPRSRSAPGDAPNGVPPDYLDPKQRTPSGR